MGPRDALVADAGTAVRRRRRLKNAVIRARLPFKGQLARAYLRVCERYRSLRGGAEQATDRNGLALPPARLRVLVAGTAEVDWFLASGGSQAGYLRSLLADVGRPIDEIDAILDFGCGCGRITRWFSDLPTVQINGCDYNGELVAWCDANLDFIQVARTGLHPPLPYTDESFDFLYAFSVFTHLSVELAESWIAELRRVVRPGGLVWFTVHGASYRERLHSEEKARFDAGDIVVWFPEIEGTNLCCSYWPVTAVERILGSDFEVLAHLDPQADPATAERLFLTHDAYLVRRL
jgi:SAM-dependent methyltransferase